jgi:hypothetical protein
MREKQFSTSDGYGEEVMTVGLIREQAGSHSCNVFVFSCLTMFTLEIYARRFLFSYRFEACFLLNIGANLLIVGSDVEIGSWLGEVGQGFVGGSL